MPPYDAFEKETLLEAMTRLFNERDMSHRFTKRGDKRPLADVEAQKAARRRNRQARRDAAIDRISAEATKRNSTARPVGQEITGRMLRAMEPGLWYGAGDLARMVGESRSARGKVRQVMLTRGWVEAAQNGQWEGVTLNPWEIMQGGEPHPKWLYRLTAPGLELRAELERLTSGE